MKTVKPVNEPEEESLPFSFVQKDIKDEKVKAHWEKIKQKIKSGPILPDEHFDSNIK